MGFKGLKFGYGPRELGGSVDLISHYRLWPHHEFFCKRSLPSSISETNYLQNVVGDREIRKDGGQLFDDVTQSRKTNGCIRPFRLDILADVFHMQGTTTADLSLPDRGIATAVTKLKSKSKERHSKKHGDRDKRKSKDHTKHRHQLNDRDDNDGRDKSINGPANNGLDHLRNQLKKRRHNVSEHTSRLHKRQINKGPTQGLRPQGHMKGGALPPAYPTIRKC